MRDLNRRSILKIALGGIAMTSFGVVEGANPGHAAPPTVARPASGSTGTAEKAQVVVVGPRRRRRRRCWWSRGRRVCAWRW